MKFNSLIDTYPEKYDSIISNLIGLSHNDALELLKEIMGELSNHSIVSPLKKDSNEKSVNDRISHLIKNSNLDSLRDSFTS